MSVIGIFRNVKIQTELLLPLAVSFQKLLENKSQLFYKVLCSFVLFILQLFQTFIQPNRQVWGNVNIPNKRGRSRPNRHWDPKNKGLKNFLTNRETIS